MHLPEVLHPIDPIGLCACAHLAQRLCIRNVSNLCGGERTDPTLDTCNVLLGDLHVFEQISDCALPPDICTADTGKA